MKYVALEEAWGTIRNEGYYNKFEGNWEIMHPGEVMVGRALTATFLPASPELEERMHETGRQEGLSGAMNQYPIYMLKQGDVYVADGFGKIRGGTLIGDNLGQAIYSNSGNGVVFYGSARDLGGLREIEGFNAWVKGWHPSYIQEMMLMGINVPIRIGSVTVMPGDVILAKKMGVVFIPPHLVEEIVITAEIVQLRDEFTHQRVREGVYTAGQVDARWTDEIEEDFMNWLLDGRTDRLPVSIEEMQEFLQHRTW